LGSEEIIGTGKKRK